jgi:hypothetical protein
VGLSDSLENYDGGAGEEAAANVVRTRQMSGTPIIPLHRYDDSVRLSRSAPDIEV